MRAIHHIYVHIPFCAKKCIYCDFPIQAVGNSPEHRRHFLTMQNQYVDRLIEEIQLTYRSDRFQRSALKTIYFGGGTPSLLTPRNFSRLTETLLGGYTEIHEDFEFSVENEPDSIDPDLLRTYKDFGVNRLTMGVQTLQEESLRFLNRNHSRGDVFKAFEHLVKFYDPRDIGFDVLLGVPRESSENLEATIKQLCSLNPGHLSAYILTVEKATKLFQLTERNQVSFDDESLADRYTAAQQLLTDGGFAQYEVSNFYNKANGGKRSAHNSMYWKSDIDFYGFGMGATSLLAGRRFARPTSLKKYYQFLEKLQATPDFLVNHGEDEAVCLNEKLKTLFMGNLRSIDGLTKERLVSVLGQFGQLALFEPLEVGLRHIADTTDGRLVVSQDNLRINLQGFLILNAILRQIFGLIDRIAPAQ